MIVRMDHIQVEPVRCSTCPLWKPHERSCLLYEEQRSRTLSWSEDVGVYISLDRKTIRRVIRDNGGYNTVAVSPIQKPMSSTWKNVLDTWDPRYGGIAMPDSPLRMGKRLNKMRRRFRNTNIMFCMEIIVLRL
jgi:hypothetical protein